MAGKTTGTTTKKPRRTTPVKSKSKPAVAEATPIPSVVRVRRQNPIFRSGTWLSILLLIALIGLTVYLKREKDNAIIADATPVSEAAKIFAEDGIVSSIEIKPANGGETVKVARNAEKAWAVILPFEAEANQGLAEAAASQVSALQVMSQINADPEIFGLKNPAFTITIEFAGGKSHTLEVGDATPTNNGYYVRLDKSKMMITDLSGIDSLLQLGFFPPYLNTPTPTSLPPTLTPVPATEGVSTPGAPATPVP